MKTHNFGWSRPVRWGASMTWEIAVSAEDDYKQRRINGTPSDAPPRPFPQDGKFSRWIKCPDEDSLPQPQADGSYKEIQEKEEPDSWCRIRMEAGPDSKAWMLEYDGNYLTRLEHEGQTEKAAELRASLPKSHPHFRPATSSAPAPSPALLPTESSGGASGSAPAPSLAPASALPTTDDAEESAAPAP